MQFELVPVAGSAPAESSLAVTLPGLSAAAGDAQSQAGCRAVAALAAGLCQGRGCHLPPGPQAAAGPLGLKPAKRPQYGKDQEGVCASLAAGSRPLQPRKMLSETFPLVVASALAEGQSSLTCSYFIMNIFSLVTYFQSRKEIQGVIISLET